MTAAVEQWRPLAQSVIQAQGSPVPEGLVLAIIDAESGGNPKAYRGEAAIADGSLGLMQVLYGTARGMGYTGQPGDKNTLSGLFDPATNITYGLKYLTGLWAALGNVADVASAYNGGIRPSLGFGGVLPAGSDPVTVCLARDSAGNCTKHQVVNPGEYGNPDYVNKVLRLMQDYSGAQPLPGVVVDGGTEGGATTPGMLAAIVGLGVLALWAKKAL